MAEWLLIWILTVEKFDGTIKDTQPMSAPMSSKTECIYEAEAKMGQLENLIGKNHYITSGIVFVGGKITGVKVGCKQRNHLYEE